MYLPVLDPAGPTTITTWTDAADTGAGFVTAPRLTTSAVTIANAVRRSDRWEDARWAPFWFSDKILPPYCQTPRWGAVTESWPPAAGGWVMTDHPSVSAGSAESAAPTNVGRDPG